MAAIHRKNSTEKGDINRYDRGCYAFDHEHHCVPEPLCYGPQHHSQFCHLEQREIEQDQHPNPTTSSVILERNEMKTCENSLSMQVSPPAIGPNDQDTWRQVVYTKERELQQIREYHVQELQRKLMQEKSEKKELGNLLEKLRNDFKYNLRLIDGRDAELDRYESMLDHIKACLKDKEREASELSKHVEDLLNRESDIEERQATTIIHWQAKCKDLRDGMDRLKWSKEESIREARKEASKAKAQLSKHTLEAEDALEVSRRELTVSFEEVIGQREQESKSRESILQSEIDRKREQVADEERKVLMLNAEILALRNETSSLQRDLSTSQREVRAEMRKFVDLQQASGEEMSKLQEERDRLVKEVTIAHDIGERRVCEVIDLLRVAERALEAKKEHFESALLKQQRSLAEREGALQIEIDTLREVVRKHQVSEAKHRAELKQAQDQLCTLEDDIASERVAGSISKTESQAAHEKLKSAELELSSNKTLLDDARVKVKKLEADARHLQNELNSTWHESSANKLTLEGSLREARDRVDEVEKRFREAEEDFKSRTLANDNEKERLSRRILYLEQCLHGARDSDFSALNEGMAGSPLFSDDMGPAFPLQKPTGKDLAPIAIPGVELSKLKEENTRLKQVISEMRCDVEELSRDEIKTREKNDRRVNELENMCKEQRLQLSAVKFERDKLMELSNSLRADLSRVAGSAVTEEDTRKTVDAAVESARRELHGKYKTKLSKIEVAFRAVSEDNARLHDYIRKSRGAMSSMDTLEYNAVSGSSISVVSSSTIAAIGVESLMIVPTLSY